MNKTNSPGDKCANSSANFSAHSCAADSPAWKNPDLTPETRAADQVRRLDTTEKISQLIHNAPAIERLGIPAYTWWNEASHGVARAGIATSFPVALGMAATFNPPLVQRVADVISTEGRAKYHEASRRGDTDYYKGLTFWSPNINLFRDPRWGRGMETFGECPFLAGRLGVAYVRGMQGDDPRYLKTIATPKHFAVHSGPEPARHSFDAVVSPRDLRETYLPHFADCVREGGAWSVMSAYNRTNGEACSASPSLLQRILREEWGFRGYVVSDCGAVEDIYKHHKLVSSAAEAAALALKNGCDLECGCAFLAIAEALGRDLLTEADIDLALSRLMEARIRLGMFDPPERVPWANIPYDANDRPEHRALAAEAARQSIVLLKNKGGLLPLPKNLRTVAVIGPNADSPGMLLGNYCGMPSHIVTPLEAIRAKLGPATRVLFTDGCGLVDPKYECQGTPRRGFAEAAAMAERADVVIACMGISPEFEGEEGDAIHSDAKGDRVHLNLVGQQEALLKVLLATGKPVVLVLINAGALAVNFAQEHVPAILETWYGGEEAGTALADVLFGDASPAGRLPVTFPTGVEQLPPFENYDMTGRTYRFFEGEPLYPFGFGLSYTQFAYSEAAVREGADGGLEIRAKVANTGARASDEVVQLYLRHIEPSVRAPIRDLRGVERIHLRPGETRLVQFTLTPRHLALFADDGRSFTEPGWVEISVGGAQPDARSLALGAAHCAIVRHELKRPRRDVEY